MAGAPLKKQRMQADTVVGCGSPPCTNYLSRLPLEMLAEILSYTASPDILSLARTSRLFCANLVTNPASKFIWRDARKRFQPTAIPDPAPNWTESAYIAFIFDQAMCEVCNKPTGRTPYSYALRAHLCYAWQCSTKWVEGLTAIHEQSLFTDPTIAVVKSWLPFHEAFGRLLYRTAEWEAAVRHYQDSTQNTSEYAKKALLLRHIMRYAKSFHMWSETLEMWREDVRHHNTLILHRMAEKEEWELKDFVNTPLYTSLRTLKDKTFEKIVERDLAILKSQFLEEVAHCRGVRIHRAVENTARVNREDLRSYWNMLKTFTTDALPSYPEFLRLDMAKTLALKNTDEKRALNKDKESVRQELKNNAGIREHLTQQIDAWLHDKRTKLAERLGYTRSELVMATGHIHPAERIIAWFQCTRCHRVGRNHEGYKALSFANVCGHQCLGLPKKDKPAENWNVDWFKPDEQAIAGAKELLRVCTLDEKCTTAEHLGNIGCRLLCKACPDSTVMDALSVIGHCKRHESVTLELLTTEQAQMMMRTPLQFGLVSKLMGFSKRGMKQRQRQTFICRHCQSNRVFTFDGLRSHVKTKHGINDMRDEDVIQTIADL